MPASAPPSPLRRRRHGPALEAQRDEILSAVRRLHASGGYPAVTMRSVSDAVGLAPMSLYRYFPNKLALLQAVWDQVLEEALVAAERAPVDGPQPIQELRRFYRGYVDYWLAEPGNYWLIFGIRDSGVGQPFSAGPAARFRQAVERRIDACLPPDLGAEDRARCYDLCRCKIVGYLFLAIHLVHKSHTQLHDLRDAVLDDIEHQLVRAGGAAV